MMPTKPRIFSKSASTNKSTNCANCSANSQLAQNHSKDNLPAIRTNKNGPDTYAGTVNFHRHCAQKTSSALTVNRSKSAILKGQLVHFRFLPEALRSLGHLRASRCPVAARTCRPGADHVNFRGHNFGDVAGLVVLVLRTGGCAACLPRKSGWPFLRYFSASSARPRQAEMLCHSVRSTRVPCLSRYSTHWWRA